MKTLKKIHTFILDTLFPITCVRCNNADSWFCEKCLEDMKLLSFQVCPKCESVVTESGSTCRQCKTIFDLDALIIALKYKENNINRLVHLYKYRFIEELHIPLGKILTKTLSNSQLPIPNYIIPVPLHHWRQRWRGFNQSELLANYIGKNLTPGLEIPIIDNLLQRKKYTSPQMKIKKYSQRLHNLRDAFSLNPDIVKTDNFLNNKTILLVDDIATTGATLFECAKILKKNGAKKVFAIVIARQEII